MYFSLLHFCETLVCVCNLNAETIFVLWNYSQVALETHVSEIGIGGIPHAKVSIFQAD